MTMFAELAVRAQLAVGDLLADGSSPQDIDPSTGKGPEWGKAAPIGLLVIVLLCIAGYFLARSMSKHLRKVQQQADAARQEREAELVNVEATRAGEAAAGEGAPDASTESAPVAGDSEQPTKTGRPD